MRRERESESGKTDQHEGDASTNTGISPREARGVRRNVGNPHV
jgi:hypothetical protein